MPGLKRRRDDFDVLAEESVQTAADFDPEDDAAAYSSGADDSDSDGAPAVNSASGRDHYQNVGKSALRAPEVDSLGPRYSGSRVSRERADTLDAEHDPFKEHSGSEGGDLEGSSNDDEIDAEDDSSRLPRLAQRHSSNGAPGVATTTIDRAELRQIMDRENKAVAASLNSGLQTDAQKGRAVKRQRRGYESLLNARIRLQKSLIAVNSMQSAAPGTPEAAADESTHLAAESAALKLWHNLDNLRQTLSSHGSASVLMEPALVESTPLGNLWSHMDAVERKAKTTRDSVLAKWSRKTASLAQQTKTASQHRLDPSANATQATIVDILQTQHLSRSNMTRLLQRTRTPRSCAPAQASAGVLESADIFDDADFYGQMLKELLESRDLDATSVALDVHERNGSGSLAAERAYQSARQGIKVKKLVDTKASKGRKMRYTVHERLQNFMAPEIRGTWSDRQVDELFGSLLGNRIAVERQDDETGGAEGQDAEDALRLFRS